MVDMNSHTYMYGTSFRCMWVSLNVEFSILRYHSNYVSFTGNVLERYKPHSRINGPPFITTTWTMMMRAFMGDFMASVNELTT